MKTCSKCKVEKPIEGFNKDCARKDGLHNYCRICMREYNRGWRNANPDKEKERNAEWYSSNPEKSCAITAKRRAAKLQATPAWADDRYVKTFYAMAAEATALTGIEHQVDHIVPLQSDIVCGLHWEQNLQVLSTVANIAKGNRHWPDMP